ncbi:hypothetical protein LCGC14_1151840 [marine sediment metagenome]|uniref:Uncharacterized protein n=1 Tax=marine sediment metagenome TaxID=412755 RepID=A0A0F9MIG3_9ZZZZ
MIPFLLDFYWSKPEDTVTIRLGFPPSPIQVLTLKTEDFFVFCQGVAGTATDFTTQLRARMAEAKPEPGPHGKVIYWNRDDNLKAELTNDVLDKLMQVKHDFEENRESDDVERQ